MNTSTRFNVRGLSLLIAGALILTDSIALSQEADYRETIEEIVTTGTRKEGQSPTETLSPIDVLAGDTLNNQSTFDMTDGLSKVAPSITTQRFPIADGTSFIRPVSLRNLSPDQTLVLVNGTRRHRSPLVNLQFAPLGTVNQGAQAVDYATLPAAAIKRVEILRDGASAQYGSDAIAGVVNVILKDADEGISLSAQTGEYFEGDGQRTTLSANGGLSLGGAGFLNATVEYSTADKTSRGVPHFQCADVAAVAGQDAVPLNGLCQRWGDPDVETLKFFLNAAFDLSESIELFGNLSYSDNETISDFFYRAPVLPPSAMIAGRDTLIVDADGDFVPDPAPQSLVDSIVGDGMDPADFLTPDAGSPSGFVLLNPIASMFPGGYNPNFGADIVDQAIVLGVRGETAGGFSWDVRGRYAEAEVDYVLSDSINPSLGGMSPTSFRPGKLTQEETGFTADFVKPFDIGNLASPLNFAFGFEIRDETYKIAAGDSASISAGPVFIFGVGSDGFQGFPTDSAGSFSSDSIAAYVDVEADVTDNFAFGAAVRFEDYDEFGNTFDGKLSGRLEITETFALRATANTGFRIPTPGQVNTLNVTTSADENGNLIPSGTYPVNHPVAIVLGAQPLDPEESTSFTIGAVFEPFDNTQITLDYYNIEIEDRLALLGPLTISAANVAELQSAGVPNADLLLGSLASHFVNAFDSDITGIDLAVTSTFDVANGSLIVDLRANFNEQEVSNVAPSTINASRVFDLENQVPQERATLTFDYQTGELFGGYVRLNHYGSWESTGGLFSPGDASDVSSYGSELLVDVEAQFNFNDRFRIAVGGENVFDVEPDNEGDFVLGLLGVDKALTSPFGVNGGFWYARLTADF
jgi:iron complex outermembrane receptor protein